MTKLFHVIQFYSSLNLIFFSFSLEWVESFQIVNNSDDCDTHHLEIAYKFGAEPRTFDILKYFGENILPFITYKKGTDYLARSLTIFYVCRLIRSHLFRVGRVNQGYRITRLNQPNF